MPTPESRVKEKTRTSFKRRSAYWHMPVQNGMGKPALDFHVCLPVKITPEMVGSVIGVYVGVETKASGKTFTPRQRQTKAEIEAAGGKVFLIEGDTSEFDNWNPGEMYDRSQRDDRSGDVEQEE